MDKSVIGKNIHRLLKINDRVSKYLDVTMETLMEGIEGKE